MKVTLTGDVEGTIEIADENPRTIPATIAAAIKLKFEEHEDVSRDTVWRFVAQGENTLEFENDFGHAVTASL